MMRTLLIALSLVATAADARPHRRPAPLPKVAIVTSEGTITAVLEAKRAPITTANFLHYVDDHRFDGTYFYRAARAIGNAKRGFIQGGVHRDARRSLLPIAHEPTSKTGLRHLDGTISMARREPGSAMGEFFILVGAAPSMDAHPGAPGDNAGYAAFGRVVSGMPVVKRILASKTWPAGPGAMKDQLIKQRVAIITARRIS